jgi:4-carboxymuconolactone decarboxylase
MRVLLVEDDRELADYVRRALEEEHYAVTVCFDGSSGLKAIQTATFDILVLDVMLPTLDGFELTRRARLEGVQAPILFLTGRDAPEDIVRGLDAGGDDYLTKPFSLAVLLARIRARTRPADSARSDYFRFADLTIDFAGRIAARAGQDLKLTKTEFAILECLARSAGRVVTRERLLDTVWGDREVGSNNLEVFIRLAADLANGASPGSSMTHIAITEHRDGTAVQWMDKVSDEQYNGLPPGAAAQAPATAQTQVQSQPSNAQPGATPPSGPLQQRIAPGLAALTDEVLFGEVWRRTELSPRDRSLVTISVLIATGKPAQLAGHLRRALTNGVRPGEASGLLAHLAIYCGWPSAVSALEVYEQVYTARKVDTAALRALTPRLSPPSSDPARAKALNDEFGAVAPKFVQLTNNVVFDDLWRRSDLTLRDRSLVTIAALAAMGDDDQLDFYLRRGLESGLTRDQITEAFTHLAFYAGWARATKAMTATARTLGTTATPSR